MRVLALISERWYSNVGAWVGTNISIAYCLIRDRNQHLGTWACIVPLLEVDRFFVEATAGRLFSLSLLFCLCGKRTQALTNAYTFSDDNFS